MIVLGDKIKQGIEDEILAVFQQQGTCLAALADQGVGFGVTIAASNDVAIAGKDMGFDELQLACLAHGRVGDDEQRVAEGFQLRPAVFFQGIFDGQFMQVELALQIGQFLSVGLFQADPDEMPRFTGPLTAFVDTDVGDFSAGAVHRRRNDSSHGDSLLLICVPVAWSDPQISATTHACGNSASIRSIQRCICSRHCSARAGTSCWVRPLVAIGGSERMMTLLRRQLFRLKRRA
ncbi:hypothetical protein D3C78_785280 [compost metagenome]